MNNTITQNLMVGLLKFKLFRLLYNYAMQSRLRFVLLFVIPLFGTLVLGWRYILLFYWLENVVIGIFLILRITLNADKSYSFWTKISNASIIAFVYYFAAFVLGIFALGSAVLIFTPEAFRDVYLNQSREFNLLYVLRAYVFTNSLWNYVYILAGFHLIEYIWEHIIKGGYSQMVIDDIDFDATIHRTMVLHLSTLISAFIVCIPAMAVYVCLAFATEYLNYDISTATSVAIRVLEACVIVIMTGVNIAILKRNANNYGLNIATQKGKISSYGVKREYTSWKE